MQAPNRICVVCGKGFLPRRADVVTCSEPCRAERTRAYDAARQRARRAARMETRTCEGCGADFQSPYLKQVYCSRPCKCRAIDAKRSRATSAEERAARPLCRHCAGPIPEKTNRRAIYCANACRKAAHMAKYQGVQLDGEGEIPIVDLEAAPRRLRLAKMFDRFEGGELFDHWTPLQWINPADRRFSR
jgi:hypothetical protein